MCFYHVMGKTHMNSQGVIAKEAYTAKSQGGHLDL